MKFISALTTKKDWLAAVDDLRRQLQSQDASVASDLAVLFVQPQFLPDIEPVVAAVRQMTGAKCFFGCTGAGIIGCGVEVEGQPAMSVLVGQMPGVVVTASHLTEGELDEASGAGYWHFQLAVEPQSNPGFLLVTDPFSIHVTRLVHELGEAFPGAPVVGGVASGAQEPGKHRLFLNDRIYDEGAVCVAVSGQVSLQAFVAQGCKPIGQPLTITRAEKNIIFEMGGQPPLQVLQELLPTLAARDQKLAKSALALGRVVNEYQESFRRGDFLIRNLLGHDPQSGALAVGDVIRTGQTVQFQVRDERTADEDLRELLAGQKTKLTRHPPRGALLFNCLGRGQGMFGEAGHDARVIQEELGPVAVAGFFANGEIGPVGGKPFVHGFSSAIGLFCEPGE